MTFLSEASETMASYISTAEQEPNEKKCKFFYIYSRGILVYLKSSSYYFTPTYHFANFKLGQGIAKLPSEFACLVFQSETKLPTVRKVEVFRCIEVVQNNKFIIIDKAIVVIN